MVADRAREDDPASDRGLREPTLQSSSWGAAACEAARSRPRPEEAEGVVLRRATVCLRPLLRCEGLSRASSTDWNTVGSCSGERKQRGV